MLDQLNPDFNEEQEEMLVQESRSIATVIARLGFHTKDGQRIELDMPYPMPLARHWAERGMRFHPELAVIKPVRSEQGEEVWVPKDSTEPGAPESLDDVPVEQLEELKGLVQMLTDRIAQAEALQNGA